MRVKATILLALFVLICASCTGAMSVPPVAEAEACAAPMYGLVTDERYKTLTVEHGSPADYAGVKVGDLLIDATVVKLLPIVCNDVVFVGPDGSPLWPQPGLNATPSAFIPATPIGPISFSDQEAITKLLTMYAILKFSVQRGDKLLEITMRPVVPTLYEDFSKGTPTPFPDSYHFF